MTRANSSSFLRNALVLDAAVSGATGALMIGAAGMVDGLLGLPVALTRSAGIILIPYAAFVAYVGTRDSLSLPAVWAVIVTNALWAAASVALLLSGWVAPTALGYAFVIAQAAVVAVFGELQYRGLTAPGGVRSMISGRLG